MSQECTLYFVLSGIFLCYSTGSFCCVLDLKHLKAYTSSHLSVSLAAERISPAAGPERESALTWEMSSEERNGLRRSVTSELNKVKFNFTNVGAEISMVPALTITYF